MATLAILPAKSFTRAKQRLAGSLGPRLRGALAEAMLSDVMRALAACEAVGRVVVISPSPRVRELAEGFGALALPDRARGHNHAAAVGIRAAVELGAERALLVPGDCPALDPHELDGLLARPVPSPSALIVPDRHGTGTNALLLSPPGALAPSFGPGSAGRHLAGALARGVHAEIVEVPSLALDVDTPEDLQSLAQDARRAPRTLALLSRC